MNKLYTIKMFVSKDSHFISIKAWFARGQQAIPVLGRRFYTRSVLLKGNLQYESFIQFQLLLFNLKYPRKE